MDFAIPQLSLSVSGESPEPERVETIHKLTLSLSSPLSPFPWSSLSISQGIFGARRTLSLRGPPDTSLRRILLADVSIGRMTPAGTFETLAACEKCRQRELRKAGSAGGVGEGVAEALVGTMIAFHSEQEQPISATGTVILRFRILCYSSHHGKSKFHVKIVLRDSATGECVASVLSKPIVILDNHKGNPKRIHKSEASSSSVGNEEEGIEGRATKRGKRRGGSGSRSDVKETISSVSIASGDVQGQSRVVVSVGQQGQETEKETFPTGNGDGDKLRVKQKDEFIYQDDQDEGFDDGDDDNNREEKDYMGEDGGITNSGVLETMNTEQMSGTQVSLVVPQTGTVGGGISVTLLGCGFHPGQSVSFGNSIANDTRIWNDGALVCTLPPSPYPGCVTVALLESNATGSNVVAVAPQNFTYTDDSDLRLFAHAMKVAGTGSSFLSDNSPGMIGEFGTSPTIPGNGNPTGGGSNGIRGPYEVAKIIESWKSGEVNDEEDQDKEELIIKFIEGLAMGRCGKGIQWDIQEEQTKRSILHLSAICGYGKLCTVLLQVEPNLIGQRDVFGWDASECAVYFGHKDIADVLGRSRGGDAEESVEIGTTRKEENTSRGSPEQSEQTQGDIVPVIDDSRKDETMSGYQYDYQRDIEGGSSFLFDSLYDESMNVFGNDSDERDALLPRYDEPFNYDFGGHYYSQTGGVIRSAPSPSVPQGDGSTTETNQEHNNTDTGERPNKMYVDEQGRGHVRGLRVGLVSVAFVVAVAMGVIAVTVPGGVGGTGRNGGEGSSAGSAATKEDSEALALRIISLCASIIVALGSGFWMKASNEDHGTRAWTGGVAMIVSVAETIYHFVRIVANVV